MSVFEAMAALESLGFSFRLDENGDIKFRSYGEKTPETDALRRRLQEMEQETFDGWTDAEIDRFCEQYDRYKAVLEECR